ncbi:MAG: hypothetical protein EPN98_07790 [Phenylobacterium sp.]|nr:MAG: hypothetical protein EPN98_07790 [Phenylobacterium sp.]
MGSRSVAPVTPLAETASAPVPGVPQPANTLFSWTEGNPAGPNAFVADGLGLTLSARVTPEGRVPVVEVRGPDGRAATLAGEASFGEASAQLGVGRLDPASKQSAVLFTTFGTCAHGCGVVRLLDYLDGAWRKVEVGVIEGSQLPAFPEDLDGDGHREIQLWDRRFNYAFASFAGSYTPPQVLAVRNGRAVDVSAQLRFRRVYANYMAEVEAECRAHANGACPAYVAAAARAGQLETAWQVMLTSYDPMDDWELPLACRSSTDDAPCPSGQEVKFRTYPEALRWFLGDLGYLSPVYLPQPDATGPAFDCTKVTAETLKLVCAMPELAAADREMNELYWRAQALSRDPAGLTADQRAFILARNNAPSDAFALLRLYQAHLAQLAELAGQ